MNARRDDLGTTRPPIVRGRPSAPMRVISPHWNTNRADAGRSCSPPTLRLRVVKHVVQRQKDPWTAGVEGQRIQS